MAYSVWVQDLDVDKDVKKGIIKPGEYLVLRINFPSITRGMKPCEKLGHMINDKIGYFARYYSRYHDPDKMIFPTWLDENPISSLTRCITNVGEALEKAQKRGEKDPYFGVKGVSGDKHS
jgi:hypothetical protein